MTLGTSIEWCDATFNPWWGCERVSPGCAHCYADTLATRYGHGDTWGAGHGFRFFGEKHWQEPLKWARTLPAKLGRRPRVFCASMADVFEERPDLDEPRYRLFTLIEDTPELDWLILTKRPEFARSWLDAYYSEHFRGVDIPLPNVWMGVSIENSSFTWRADVLREIPAAVRFISAEPLLDSLFEEYRAPKTYFLEGQRVAGARSNGRAPLDLDGIDWVIIGGESGPGARQFHIAHARELMNACRYASIDRTGTKLKPRREHVATFVKQLGAKPVDATGSPMKLRDRKGGDWSEWPSDLRIREFPRTPMAVAA